MHLALDRTGPPPIIRSRGRGSNDVGRTPTMASDVMPALVSVSRAHDGVAARRFRYLYLALWVGLALFTAASYLTPFFDYALVSPTLDVVVNTATVVIAASVTLTTWIRYGDGADTDTLYIAAAFFALFVGG